jgi:hypothetical protein
MSRNYSSTIVAVIVVLFKFSGIRNEMFFDDWLLARNISIVGRTSGVAGCKLYRLNYRTFSVNSISYSIIGTRRSSLTMFLGFGFSPLNDLLLDHRPSFVYIILMNCRYPTGTYQSLRIRSDIRNKFYLHVYD